MSVNKSKCRLINTFQLFGYINLLASICNDFVILHPIEKRHLKV